MATPHPPAELEDAPPPRRTRHRQPLSVKIELIVVDGDREFGRELHKRQSAAVLNVLRRLADAHNPKTLEPNKSAA